jgi:phosphoribosylaminoimidazolecarboxamide formyltransferase / IMP cyclohydrolase
MIELRYGANPHQKAKPVSFPSGKEPLKLLNGAPSFINLLDAITAWQLVRELREATGLPSAASYKHVSPAGAAVAGTIDEAFKESQFLKTTDFSPLASAYVRARGGDRMCSFGDAAAVSDVVDVSLAQFLKTEVCDLIIAPGYEPEALEILKQKKNGAFLIFEMDPAFEPDPFETREMFGIQLSQERNSKVITRDDLTKIVSRNKEVPESMYQTLLVAAITLKYTQSNSIALAYDGQIVGLGAGQQSRIHCTRLACGKAEKWFLQRHPKVRGLQFQDKLPKVAKTNLIDQYLLWDSLSSREEAMMLEGFTEKPDPISKQEKTEWINTFSGITLASDAFIPFRDNIDRASRTNVQYIVETGGSFRENDVIQATDDYGMVHIHTGIRSFLH